MVWEHPGRVALQVHLFHDIAKVFLSNQVPSGKTETNSGQRTCRASREKKKREEKLCFKLCWKVAEHHGETRRTHTQL